MEPSCHCGVWNHVRQSQALTTDIKGAIDEVRGFEAALDVDNRSSINLRIFTFLRANYFYLNLFTFSKLYWLFQKIKHSQLKLWILFFPFFLSKWPKSKKNQLSCLFIFCKKKYEFCLKWQLIFVFLSKWPKINWYMLIVTFLNKKCFELIKTRGNFQAWKFCEKYQDS